MQSLSSLTVSIIPTNSHPPQVHVNGSELTYVENTVLNVLDDVTLTDMDEICDENVIVAAQVEMVTSADDNAQELLEVS